MNRGIESRIMYIYPIVLSLFIEEDNLCVIGEAESIGITFGHKVGIRCIGYRYTKIAIRFRHSGLTA
jgi:hypothetical protein